MNRFRLQQGAAAVELAVVLPLLIMLVFGILAFGMAFAQQLALTNAARQGARLGVVQDATCAQIADEVQGSGSTIGLDGSEIMVVVGRSDITTAGGPCALSPGVCAALPENGANLVVTASADYQLTIPLVLDSSQTLQGRGVFRCEPM